MQVSAAVQAPIQRPAPAQTAPEAENTRPGKSGQSVGHMAKAAVAEAIAAGAELPSNAQGLAASTIAKGGDVSSVFAAFIPAVEPPEGDPAPVEPVEPTEPGPVEEPTGETPVVEEPVGEEPAPGETPTGSETFAGGEGPVTETTSAETALALLSYGASAAPEAESTLNLAI